MPKKLKDILIPDDQVKKLAQEIHSVYPELNQGKFIGEVLDPEWKNRELKQKMRHITVCLKNHLPAGYQDAIKILETIAPQFNGFVALSFSDFAECYGLNEWEISMNALARFTSSCSSEFAVRPFLDINPERAMHYFYKWADDKDVHIRRLASEGCRPRLPWGMALQKFKNDPKLILPILEKLKTDPEEYVRRSVANNLNDISKDHPELVLELCENWKGQSPEIDRIVKHACRTMLKSGNVRALMIFGFANPEQISVSEFLTDQQTLKISGSIGFSFQLNNHSEQTQTIRLEYRIHYMKSNGKTSAKIFQIREAAYEHGKHHISKKQALTDFTTRKHYPGEHHIEIVVNGETKAITKFLLER